MKRYRGKRRKKRGGGLLFQLLSCVISALFWALVVSVALFALRDVSQFAAYFGGSFP